MNALPLAAFRYRGLAGAKEGGQLLMVQKIKSLQDLQDHSHHQMLVHLILHQRGQRKVPLAR